MKQIKDYPNYSITEDGVIFSNITNKALAPFNNNGYLRIGLSKDNKRKKFLVHRLIAEAFIPNDQNNLLINHKDGNKMNNHISNLEWCTYSENLKHAYKIGLYTDIKKAGVYGKHTIKCAQKANEKIVLDTQTGISISQHLLLSNRIEIQLTDYLILLCRLQNHSHQYC